MLTQIMHIIDVDRLKTQLEQSGHTVSLDEKAGTLVARRDGVATFQAQQHATGHAWVATYN